MDNKPGAATPPQGSRAGRGRVWVTPKSLIDLEYKTVAAREQERDFALGAKGSARSPPGAEATHGATFLTLEAGPRTARRR
jgi:hypothetical protein